MLSHALYAPSPDAPEGAARAALDGLASSGRNSSTSVCSMLVGPLLLFRRINRANGKHEDAIALGFAPLLPPLSSSSATYLPSGLGGMRAGRGLPLDVHNRSAAAGTHVGPAGEATARGAEPWSGRGRRGGPTWRQAAEVR